MGVIIWSLCDCLLFDTHPCSGGGEEGDQLGEGLQVLIEAGADLLGKAVLVLVVLPETHLQTQQPVTSLQQAKLG